MYVNENFMLFYRGVLDARVNICHVDTIDIGNKTSMFMVDTDLKVGMIRPCLLQASSYVHHSPYQHNLMDSLFCKQETYKHDHIHVATVYCVHKLNILPKV